MNQGSITNIIQVFLFGDKYLCIVVKFKQQDAFVITAYFTDSEA